MSQEKTLEVNSDVDEKEPTETGEETEEVVDDADENTGEEAGEESDDDEKAWLKESGLDGFGSLKDVIEAAKAHKQSSNGGGDNIQLRLMQQQIDAMKEQSGRTDRDDKGGKSLFSNTIMKDLIESRISSGQVKQEDIAYLRSNAGLWDEGLNRITQSVEGYLLRLTPTLQRAFEAADRAEYGTLPKMFRDKVSHDELKKVVQKYDGKIGYRDALELALLEKNDLVTLAKWRGVSLDSKEKPGQKTRTVLPKVKTKTTTTPSDSYLQYLNKDGTVNNEKLFKEKKPEEAMKIVNKIGEAMSKKGSSL